MYVFIYVIFTATVSHADANVTASPNQPNTTSTASTTKITPGTIPNPETANPYLLKLWKYSVRGRVNESFIADLNNADSQTFKRASDRINTEVQFCVFVYCKLVTSATLMTFCSIICKTVA